PLLHNAQEPRGIHAEKIAVMEYIRRAGLHMVLHGIVLSSRDFRSHLGAYRPHFREVNASSRLPHIRRLKIRDAVHRLAASRHALVAVAAFELEIKRELVVTLLLLFP